MLDYPQLNQHQLQHQIKLANIHLQVMKDSHTQKSGLDISHILKIMYEGSQERQAHPEIWHQCITNSEKMYDRIKFRIKDDNEQ